MPGFQGLPLKNQRVILRVDANVPITHRGNLQDDWRLHACVPTLKALLNQGARVGILTHLGRPGGRVVPHLSTRPLARRLSELLGQPIEFVPDCVGRMAEYAMEQLPPGQALMFENVRFHPGEALNQVPFIHQMALLGDVYVNDAFAAAHRAHSSTTGLAQAMRYKGAGLLMQQELDWARRILEPRTDGQKKPVVAILAGSVVAPKLELMRGLLGRVDTLILGGAVANTFLAARDLGMGHSLLEPTLVGAARELMAEAGVLGCRLHLPQDVVVADLSNPQAFRGAKAIQDLEASDVANDIGPQTIETWQRVIAGSGSVVWFGGLGLVEVSDFASGSLEMAKTLQKANLFSLVAGDGLVRMLGKAGIREQMPAVSSGSASLMQILQGFPLPAIEALKAS